MKKEKELTQERKDRLKSWVTFYRLNTHRFVEHYFGVKLYPFQIVWIWAMGIKDKFFTVASRSIGKSWLIGLYAIVRCVLYPGSTVVIVSSTMAQAGIIIGEKIQSLNNNYPNIAREILSITSGQNKHEVIFHNGSNIVVVASKESARGHRATFIIVEESRLVDKDILDSIIKPFAYVRPTPYNQNIEYHIIPPEEAKEMHITSAHFVSGWWYKEALITIKQMLSGKDSGFFVTDYLTAIHHRIKTVKQVENDKETMEEIPFQLEYLNIPAGEAGDAYFKMSMFAKNRDIKKAFYPQRKDEYNKKENPFDIQRIEGEIRLISCDVATRAGRSNDLTIISCIRLLPTSVGYHRELYYMESHSGKNTVFQTLRLKQIYFDFNADYIVLDIANAGISILDQLGNITKDDERNIEYEAMTVMKHIGISDDVYEELSRRTLAINAKENIFPISASAKLNSEIAVAFRDKLKKKMFSFLVEETVADGYLMKTYKKIIDNDDITIKAFFLHPYIQTSLFINECVNLSMKLEAGYIKLKEPDGARKDRYTCVSYANYFVGFLDNDLLKETGNTDEEFLNSIMVV